MLLPGGGSVGVFPHPPDGEFPVIFATGCRQPLSGPERRRIATYKVNVCLVAPGGCSDAVRRMLIAAGAVVRAGGLGVFVDNSGMAHRPDGWLAVADNAMVNSVFLALVTVFPSRDELQSVGMQMIGLRDAVIPQTGDRNSDYEMLNDFLEYSLISGVAIAHGDFVGDEGGPRYRLRREASPLFPPGSPLHNPYGQWRLKPLKS